MSRFTTALTCALAAAISANLAIAQSTMTPLTSFGTNGWLAPGTTSTFVTTGNTERGLAWNPTTGNLVLASRAGGNNVRVLDGTTGADLGGFDVTGITGGTFAINMAGIGDDGAIYVSNLSTSAASNFKVYKWDSELLGPLLPPTIAYDAPSGLARTGDSFAVLGGTATSAAQFASGGSSTVNNSGFVTGLLDGLNTSTPYLSIPGTTTTTNDYRLGLTFVDQSTLIGTQGANARYTTFNGVSATVDATIPLGTASRRAMDYAVIGGTPVLAVIDSISSIVTILDITYPASPTVLVSATTTTAPVANANATGSVQWGTITGNTATLYAMNTNQGIQAFSVFLQPPATAKAYGAGCGSPALALSAVGAPILPSSIQLSTDNIPATAQIGILALGFASIPGGASIPTIPGCLQYVQPLATSIFLTLGNTSVQLPQNYPNNPAYAGLSIFAQSVVVDGSTVLTSNGLRLYLETF